MKVHFNSREDIGRLERILRVVNFHEEWIGQPFEIEDWKGTLIIRTAFTVDEEIQMFFKIAWEKENETSKNVKFELL